MRSSYRILLCDDIERLRSRCREALGRIPGVEIVGEAAGGVAGVQMALALAPDLVLMDVDMPDMDGIEATRQILARNPGIKVLAYSAGSSWQIVRQMLVVGAAGFVVKGGDPEELITAVQVVLAGGRFLSGKIHVPSAVQPHLLPRLSGGGSGDPPSAEAVRVFVAEGSSIIREWISWLVSGREGIAMVGQAATAGEALVQLRENRVDVLIADLNLVQEGGPELLRVAREKNRSLLVAVLAEDHRCALESGSPNLGADYYFRKPEDIDKVLEVCQDVAEARGLSVWMASPEDAAGREA